ncbi:MAG TPA: hypothetical protein VN363_04450 [Anaerolineales bacterium]|nr:hypothetical protein [Anaerolineales bacterium]
MSFFRRLLGILVMIAGILGLVLSVAGLVGVWMVKPTVVSYADTTITTLNSSIGTSQEVMKITGEALGATIDSVDALSAMLDTTATSVEETQPVLDQVNIILGETLPSSLSSATDSLKTAQSAAGVLDSAIKSLDTFRTVLSAVPLVGSFVDTPSQPYNPEVPLSESLGSLATELEDLPQQFTDMSANLRKADDSLASIQTNLVTMSVSVAQISTSLSDYEAMIGQSQSSMDSLSVMLTNVQTNLPATMNGVGVVLSAFFVWLLIAQIVILTQGWELYQGTADRMESDQDD